MKGLSTILYLRIKQAWRATASVGLILLLVGLPLIVILSLGVFAASEDGWYISFIFTATIYGIHFSRSDRQHLNSIGYSPRLVFVAEYLCLALILGGVNYFLVGNYLNLLAMLGIAVLGGISPQANFRQVKSKLFFPANWLPFECFEWRAGIRKNGWLMILILIIGLLFAHRSPAVTLVAIVLINFISTSWYKDFETYEMFIRYSKDGLVLRKKIDWQLILSLYVMLPLSIFFLIHFISLWYLLLVVIIFSFAINIFSICYKYAGYHPSRVRTESDLAVAIFSLCVFVPFFAPITLVYLTIYYFRAKKNIRIQYAEC